MGMCSCMLKWSNRQHRASLCSLIAQIPTLRRYKLLFALKVQKPKNPPWCFLFWVQLSSSVLFLIISHCQWVLHYCICAFISQKVSNRSNWFKFELSLQKLLSNDIRKQLIYSRLFFNLVLSCTLPPVPSYQF